MFPFDRQALFFSTNVHPVFLFHIRCCHLRWSGQWISQWLNRICIHLCSLSFDSPDLVIQLELICINYKSAHSFSHIISPGCEHHEVIVAIATSILPLSPPPPMNHSFCYRFFVFFSTNINIMELLNVAKKKTSLNDGKKKATVKKQSKKRRNERTKQPLCVCSSFVMLQFLLLLLLMLLFFLFFICRVSNACVYSLLFRYRLYI